MNTERIRELVARTESLDPEPGWFGPVPDGTIKKVERTLGVRLPPSFREFVKQVGGGGPLSISGIDPDEPMGDEGTPSLHYDTTTYREYREEPFPPHLLVVSRDPEDHYTFCLDLSTAAAPGGEAPVVVYNTEDGSVERYADDFPAFYERLLVQELGGDGDDGDDDEAS
jgi:antitoxin YobK